MAKRRSSDFKFGKRDVSWQDRRWKLFEQAYNSSTEFKEELQKLSPTLEDGAVLDNDIEPLYTVLKKYDVPFVCIHSVALYLNNPQLNRTKYLELILPPFVVWDTQKDAVWLGGMDIPISDYLELLLSEANTEGEYSTDFTKLNYPELAKALSTNSGLLLEIMPNVTKTEIKEFIDDNWELIEKKRIVTNPEDDINFSPRLLGKIQPTTKTKRTTLRNERIMELHKNGKSDKEIWNYLMRNYEKYKPIPSMEYIKVIRHRNNQKTDS